MRSRRLLAVFAIAAFFCGGSLALAQTAPRLETAASFAVLAGTSIRNSGVTRVTGNAGAGTEISGLPRSAFRIGTIIDDRRMVETALSDAAAAGARLDAQACTATHPTLEGTLLPGVHCFTTADVHLGGALFLDPASNPNAVWIVRVGGTLTTAPDAVVRVTSGGAEGNVFWDVGDVRIGARTAFAGNILANTNIALGTRASLSGRALALTGSVTLDTNDISLCCVPITVAPVTLPGGTVGVPYPSTQMTASGGLGPYMFSATSLPPGLRLSTAGVLGGVPATPGTTTFSITATDAQGCPGTTVYTIAIACVVEELPDAVECDDYDVTLSAEGVCIAPALPAGFVLDGCRLTAKPVPSGRFTFSVVIDGRTHCYALDVVESPIVFPDDDVDDGTACIAYSDTIAVEGCADCTISAPAELLPPGLSLSAGGVLSGTPAIPGPFTFPVTARNATCARTQPFTMTVACREIAPPSERLDNGEVGVPYEAVLRRGECPGPHTFAHTPLPPGLFIDEDGVLRDTPTAMGSYEFTVTSTAANGCPATHTYDIDIDCPIIVSPSELPPAKKGVPYEETFTATGGIGPYVFSSTELPGGLTLSPEGTLSGAPDECDVFEFTVTARDTTGCEGLRTYELIVGCCVLIIEPESLPNATEDEPYSETFTVAGGVPPYTFTAVSGALPDGLTLSASGTLSGTPTEDDTFTFTIRVRDASCCEILLPFCAFEVHDEDCPPGTSIELTPAALPRAVPDVPYGPIAITPAGGIPPYTVFLSSGVLPAGMTFVGGVLSGTPTESGRFELTVTAEDTNGCRGSRCYTLVVSEAIPTLSEWMLLVLSIALAGVGLVALGGRSG